MKIVKVISKITNFILVLFFLVIFSFKLFGFNLMYVVSGSMEPTFYRGSLIITEKVDEELMPLQKGMVIVFDAPWYENKIVTHRIVEINGDEIITKGDNNMHEDPIGNLNNVKGVVIKSIDHIGFLFSPWAIRGLIVLTAILFIIDLYFDYRNSRYIGRYLHKVSRKEKIASIKRSKNYTPRH